MMITPIEYFIYTLCGAVIGTLIGNVISEILFEEKEYGKN